MGAEMTFGGCALVGIDVDGVVRAGLHAGFAANTAFGAEVHYPIFALVHRGHGADGHARRILAMIAASHLEDAAGVGKCPLLDVLHPGAVHGERHVVFGLARDRAGVTADALAIVDDEPVSHPGGWKLEVELPSGLGIVAERRPAVREAGNIIPRSTRREFPRI